MAADAYAIESIAYMTTGMIDRGDPSCEVRGSHTTQCLGLEGVWTPRF